MQTVRTAVRQCIKSILIQPSRTDHIDKTGLAYLESCSFCALPCFKEEFLLNKIWNLVEMSRLHEGSTVCFSIAFQYCIHSQSEYWCTRFKRFAESIFSKTSWGGNRLNLHLFLFIYSYMQSRAFNTQYFWCFTDIFFLFLSTLVPVLADLFNRSGWSCSFFSLFNYTVACL